MFVSALIGNPTDHSVSPTLFKIYADEHNLEYAHVKFNIDRSNLRQVVKSLPAYGYVGINVTLPYKMDVIPLLDVVMPEVKKIGAVNTIVNKDGNLIGYNTDKYGAIRTIEDGFGHVLVKNNKAIVFGSGGAARAIVYGLLEKGMNIAVVHRDPKSIKTKSFISDFRGLVTHKTYSDDLKDEVIGADIICNATSVGMIPNVSKSVFPTNYFKLLSKTEWKRKLFFDAVFNPAKTRFISDAEKMGAKVGSGIDMMVYQGVQAFYLWTGKKVSDKSVQKARKVLRKIL